MRLKRFVTGVAVPVVLAAAAITAFPTTVFAQTGPTTATQRLEAFEAHSAMAQTSIFGTLPWQFLGPTNVSGRVTDVAIVEPKGLSYTMYVAAASGGVWKTDNEGVTWTPPTHVAGPRTLGDGPAILPAVRKAEPAPPGLRVVVSCRE